MHGEEDPFEIGRVAEADRIGVAIAGEDPGIEILRADNLRLRQEVRELQETLRRFEREAGLRGSDRILPVGRGSFIVRPDLHVWSDDEETYPDEEEGSGSTAGYGNKEGREAGGAVD